MKKIIAVLFAVLMVVFTFAACSSNNGAADSGRIVHCDNCGREMSAGDNENIDDSWTLYCFDCEKELGLDKLITAED